MKKLLLITGDLATDKSTFAHLLSERYDMSLFFKDSIKEVLGDTIGFTNREENKKLSNASMKLMFHIFSEFARLNKGMILESNFHTEELESLHKIAEDHDYEVLTLVLRGDVELLHQRYLNRIYNENRHPVHLSTTFDIYEDFKKYTEKSRQEEIPGDSLIIDANDFSYQKNDIILKRIDDFMNV
ncbi:MAG: hypothetical protein IJ356_09730 [Erysipelotrichaceae bacterium]|nr:hypothetical protein [Erysipelotrichaceae bacterium]